MYKVSEVNLTPSLSKRKMILKQICKSQIKWKLIQCVVKPLALAMGI